ncbi:DNA polymerase I [Anaerotignum sp.]|uniref:DNA polymerase I n=1 Tax=Anaerotignum sp. TaxID=2039241 RepID=UPI00399292E8
MAEKIMLIDGNSIINRAFYGVPLLTNAEGRYTNAVYGFFNILFKLLDEDQPDYLAVAFDMHAPTFRHKTFDGYKGTRKGMPEELREQMPLLKEVLTAMRIPIYEQEGYEADDILGSLSKEAEDAGLIPVVVSGDRDLLQIAGETLKVRIPKTKGGRTETEDYYAKDVMEKYGVTPLEFIDVKALMGDTSDNIPGVPSIGEKTAVKIIQQYHDIENAIAHAAEIKPKKASENLAEFQEQARLSKFLATIIRDMPLEMDLSKMTTADIFTPEAYELIKRLEFKSMFSRFEQKTTQTEAVETAFAHIITGEEAKNFFENLKQKETAYILLVDDGVWKGMSVCQKEGEGVFLEITEELPPQTLADCAKDFFVTKNIVKIGHDVKRDIHTVAPFGVDEIYASFDTALAAYLLNPTGNSYEYDDLARDFLEEVYPSAEEVLGKGRSKQPLESLLEGERVAFAARQAEVAFRSKQIMTEKIKENEQEELFYEVEMPLLYVLADMERWGMKVDRQALLAYQKQLAESIETITKEIYELSGEEFNLNSPKQLGVILFEKMGLKGGKKTKTGYSTAADVLEKLKNEAPIVEKILYYRQLAKLKSTYADGLLAVMDDKTDKIYSTFNQTITATGRISSTEPNLQNIPVRLELGRELRRVFVPTSDEFCFLDADYSQIELRVLAHIAGDETLIDAFRHQQDIHRLTASQVFHVPFDEVTSLQRSNAKAVNFGIVYGIGSFSLSQDLGITRKEAEQYIAAYFTKYPKIKEYQERMIKEATEQGYVSTIFHRRRAMPELQSGNFVQRSFGERVAMNMPIQGSAADIIKIAMVKVHRALKEGGFRSRLILQVHDELLIETALEEKEAVAKILKENMEQAVALAVPLDVDVHEGQNWLDAK